MALTIFFCILAFLSFCGILGGKNTDIRSGSVFAMAISVGGLIFWQMILLFSR